MAIEIGQPAPDFTLKSKTATGIESVTLSEIKGNNVVLLFVPLAFTGVCTKELCSVSENINVYSTLNAKVFGISVDSMFAQEAWAQKDGISIPLLSDFNKEAATAYGCLYETFAPGNLDMAGVAKRSAFVIDKEGIIRHIEILENPGDMPNFDAIKEALSGL